MKLKPSRGSDRIKFIVATDRITIKAWSASDTIIIDSTPAKEGKSYAARWGGFLLRPTENG
jgi:hypothetical protein